MSTVTFAVYGRPAGKGSVQTVSHGGKGYGHQPKRTVNWQALVAAVAQEHVQPGTPMPTGPVAVTLKVWLAKPKSAPKTKRTWPIRRSALDIDKAVRAALDGLSGVLYADDSQVTNLFAAKGWAADGRPGIEVSVTTLGEEVIDDATHAQAPVR